MPRQRNRYNRRTYAFPAEFPQPLQRLQEESGLSWSEIARRLETYRHTVWRWAGGGVRPNHQHRKALLELADRLGLGHLISHWFITQKHAREVIEIWRKDYIKVRPHSSLKGRTPKEVAEMPDSLDSIEGLLHEAYSTTHAMLKDPNLVS